MDSPVAALDAPPDEPLDAGQPPELEGYADMAGLAEGQRVMLQLPDAGAGDGTGEPVIMEVVHVDGNQIHFIAPDPAARSAGPVSEHASFAEDAEELKEVEVPRCFLCLRPADGAPLHCLVLGRTASSGCPLVERLGGCAAPHRLDVSTADSICEQCLQLINAADGHYHRYQLECQKISELVVAGSGERRPAAEPVMSQDQLKTEARSPSAAAGGEDSDSDWSPGGLAPRSTRSRVPKARRRWSPEPIARPAPAPAVPSTGAPRPRGRPRKHPRPPTVIEYSDIDTLKEQVKDIETEKFDIKPAQPEQPAKTDLEKIIHLEVRTEESGTAPAARETSPAARGRGRPPAQTAGYECRRCEIQFQDSQELVVHLRQHVNKPWCKRCRTEFPHRSALLEHSRGCRLRHRSGHCSVCDRRVPLLRHHLRRHSQLEREGALPAGAPLPEEEDRQPEGHRRAGKLAAGGVCSICGEYVPERLRKHERSHNITHTCPICKKVFTREDVVRGHIRRVHMKERPHVCAQCGKTFVSVYSLQRHEMIHNNEYRFYCQECGDGFRQKQQLTAHMRHKHGVVDVVFEDVQVMPEGAAVVDALSVITERQAYGDAVLEAGEFDKEEEEYVITAAADAEGEHVQLVTDPDGRLLVEG